MSAYSEWKAGMITDAQYNSICRQEWDEEQSREPEDEWDEEEVFEDDDIDEF